MTLDEKRRRVMARSWYHSIEIEPGLVTPGIHSLKELRRIWACLDLPASLTGLSVLDVGSYDGFFSFEAERRGAKRVVSYDLAPADYFGFATAKEVIGSQVEYIQGSIYDLRPEVAGTFDVVLFLGVLYHLRYPLLALDRIRDVCDGSLLLETHYLDNHLLLEDGQVVRLEDVEPRLSEVPLYRFYRADEFNGDYTNWFSLNRRAIEDALWTAGFEPRYLSAWNDRVVYRATRSHETPEYLQQTYEGVRFVREGDGTRRNASITRVHPARPHGSVAKRDARPLRHEQLAWLLQEAETDRTSRLRQVQELTGLLRDAEADRVARLVRVEELTQCLRESEADRAARLVQVEELTQRLRESEADRAARLVQVEELTQRLRESETDRAARLDQIVELTRILHERGRWRRLIRNAIRRPWPP